MSAFVVSPPPLFPRDTTMNVKLKRTLEYHRSDGETANVARECRGFRAGGRFTDLTVVCGRDTVPDPRRHVDTMAERDRKDFHVEFTTLRFTCLSEHGEWNGRRSIVPS